ncbi:MULTISPECIES: hypothetical protein [unclassified Streptomyces]|uniref:hypothetical protein n=1 Tax=unclassified Streptomyces TaxID=2593676 RepID=UPI0036F4CAD8
MLESDAFTRFENGSLAERREAMTGGADDQRVRAAVLRALDKPVVLSALQEVLEEIRSMPPGMGRITAMNTFVRTLGQPATLASFLDVLRASLTGSHAGDAALAERSRRGRMHCVYGWSGQTLMLTSAPSTTAGTVEPSEDMGFLGYPPAEWDMSIHIWQPNPRATGFASTKRIEPGVIVEPPHSHPFAFASFVATGQMHQSLYREAQPAVGQRYAGVELQRVDGVWPPHEEYRGVRLATVEERVLLQAGDSYYMPPEAIHDVEVDSGQAARTPAVTLFLCAEATVKPRAYLVPAMARFHENHPELKDEAVALTTSQWQEKLKRVARYLRGQSEELVLDDVVDCATSYAFMHI